MSKYHWLIDEIKSLIANGDYDTGGKFYSERDLVKKYSLSHFTVRQALAELEKDGKIARIQGRGTFVASQLPVEQNTGLHIGLALADTVDPAYPSVSYEILNVTRECNRRFWDLRTFTYPPSGIHNNHCRLREVIDAGDISGLLAYSPLCYEDIVFLKKSGLPFVMVGNDLPGADVYSVTVDEYRGIFMATEHLIELGHREIGFINGPSGSYANTLFALGYRTAMDKHGIPIHDHLVMEMPWGEESGKKAIETWLSSSFPLPSAILAIEELMALGVMRCAIEKGYAIPDDLSVAGYSNRLEPSVYPVPLTTVDTLTCKQDNLAVDLLADLMAGKADKRKLRIEPELVVRLSCSRPVKSSRTQTMSKL